MRVEVGFPTALPHLRGRRSRGGEDHVKGERRESQSLIDNASGWMKVQWQITGYLGNGFLRALLLRSTDPVRPRKRAGLG